MIYETKDANKRLEFFNNFNMSYYKGINGEKNEYNCNREDDFIPRYKHGINLGIPKVYNMNIKSYLKATAKRHNRIVVDDDILAGMPSINGRRIPVSLILSCFKDNMSIKEICSEYLLNEEDVQSALDFVVDLLDYPYQEDENEIPIG